MTTTKIFIDKNGKEISACTDTLATANATVKMAVETHNANCAVQIKARIKDTLQVSVTTASGRAKKWHCFWMVTQVEAFANGIADVVEHGSLGNAPTRDFVSHADEAAYFYGTVAGQSARAIDATSDLPLMSAAEREQAKADVSKRADEMHA